MKRFRFPLERVRRWRAEQAGLEELKLQQLRAEADQLSSQKLAVETERVRSAKEVLARPSIEAIELSSLDTYGLCLRRQITELTNLERTAAAKTVEQRQRVLEARRQFKLLDRLHAKALAQWRAASNKEQEDLAAELFLARSARKR
jgi:flagellar FliJ protein